MRRVRSTRSVSGAVVAACAAALTPVASAVPCPGEIRVGTGPATLTAPPGCDLTGAVVAAGEARVEVPPAGRFVVLATTAATPAGVDSLAVRHLPGGVVDVDAVAAGPAPDAQAADDGDTGCGDAEQPGWDGTMLVAALPWTFSVVNEDHLPPFQFLSDDTVSNYWTSAYLGGTYLQDGHNDCGLARGRFGLAAPVLPGTFSVRQTDVGLDGTCASSTDGASTIQVASLYVAAYAVSCHWGVVRRGADVTTEFDIRINQFVEFSTDPSATSSPDPDLLGVMVHEWGHAYGMRHQPLGHPYQTMNGDGTYPGPWLRTLGRGDYLGMLEVYRVDGAPSRRLLTVGSDG